MTNDATLNVNVVLPVHSGGSGGLVRHLAEVTPRWVANSRVQAIVIHAPSGLLPVIDEMGVEVKRYHAHHIGPFAKRFAPAVSPDESQVVLNVTSRPIRSGGAPLVTMVQNIEPIQAAQYRMPFLWRLRCWALRRETLKACHDATRVIAVSRYVKECLCSAGVPGAKVDVVYHGASEPTEVERCPRACSDLSGPFVFTAGSILPYRGVEDLIRAVAILKTEGKGPPSVVIGGSGGGLARNYERWVRGLPESLGVREKVIWAGQLADCEMTWGFHQAAAVVQTSRAEACPNFLLEALAAGCPIVSCSQPPMREILGDAASYYTLGDAAKLASSIGKRLSMTGAETAAQREVTLARASMLTWDQTACQTLDSLDAAREDVARARM